MQISRHWRLNAKRYRLEGVRYTTGDVSLQERPFITQTVSGDGRPQPISGGGANPEGVYRSALSKEK